MSYNVLCLKDAFLVFGHQKPRIYHYILQERKRQKTRAGPEDPDQLQGDRSRFGSHFWTDVLRHVEGRNGINFGDVGSVPE